MKYLIHFLIGAACVTGVGARADVNPLDAFNTYQPLTAQGIGFWASVRAGTTTIAPDVQRRIGELLVLAVKAPSPRAIRSAKRIVELWTVRYRDEPAGSAAFIGWGLEGFFNRPDTSFWVRAIVPVLDRTIADRDRAVAELRARSPQGHEAIIARYQREATAYRSYTRLERILHGLETFLGSDVDGIPDEILSAFQGFVY